MFCNYRLQNPTKIVFLSIVPCAICLVTTSGINGLTFFCVLGFYFTPFHVYFMVGVSKMIKCSCQVTQNRAYISLFCRALAVPWLGTSYGFAHLLMLVFGVWVVIQPSSHDANQVVLKLHSMNV